MLSVLLFTLNLFLIIVYKKETFVVLLTNDSQYSVHTRTTNKLSDYTLFQIECKIETLGGPQCPNMTVTQNICICYLRSSTSCGAVSGNLVLLEKEEHGEKETEDSTRFQCQFAI